MLRRREDGGGGSHLPPDINIMRAIRLFMAELHHKIGATEETCGVKGCSSPALRSLPTKKVTGNISAGLKSDEPRRTHLCKEHYREYKKKTKDERLTDTLAWKR